MKKYIYGGLFLSLAAACDNGLDLGSDDKDPKGAGGSESRSTGGGRDPSDGATKSTGPGPIGLGESVSTMMGSSGFPSAGPGGNEQPVGSSSSTMGNSTTASTGGGGSGGSTGIGSISGGSLSNSSSSGATGCLIQGVTYALSALNPNNACQHCDPASSAIAWSTVSDGVSCGSAQVCSKGSCAGGCFIAGTVYTAGSINPNDPCQKCDPAQSTSSWVSGGSGTVCYAPQWHRGWPGARSSFSMTALGKGGLVLTGGQGASQRETGQESLLFDGTRWTDETTSFKTTGISGRAAHATAFDSQRNRVILFGGWVLSPGFFFRTETTWERTENGTWVQGPDATHSPPARYAHAMAYDDHRGVAVLFGGINDKNIFLRDTWEYDGKTWSKISNLGPTPRAEHKMVYDPTRSVVVLHGGRNGSAVQSDTWEWNGTTWSQQGDGPQRTLHSMTFDKATNKILLFGGRDATWAAHGNTYQRDAQGHWTEVAKIGPSPRHSHDMAYDASTQATYLFGGDSGSPGSQMVPLSDLWFWKGGAWNLVSKGAPSRRYAHAMAYDSTRKRSILFGGRRFENSSSTIVGDTWEWDGKKWLSLPVAGPEPREGAAMAYDPLRKKTVLFGGTNIGPATDTTTWEWDGQTWTATTAKAPNPRLNHAMAYDPVLQGILLYGGKDASGNPQQDTWLFDGTQWSLLSADGPAPMSRISMTTDETHGRVFLCGRNQGSSYGGLYAWDGSGWTKFPSPATGECGHLTEDQIAFDTPRNQLVLFGGTATSLVFDGTAWSSIGGDLPKARSSSALSADAYGAVLFSGLSPNATSALGDTWVFGRE